MPAVIPVGSLMDVLNPWMLAGLAGVVLPLFIHLLARRQVPVIDWGAMQFLQPALHARRSFSIDEGWLLIVRMLALTLLALAMARPWISGSLLSWRQSLPRRDVAVVLDGSFSTAAPLDETTLQEVLRGDVQKLLSGLSAESTVQIYDARDAVVPLVPQLRSGTATALTALHDLRPPTGTSHLPTAILAACRDLLDTQHHERDVVVFADDQARAWRPEEAAAWNAIDAQIRQAAVRPRVSVILRHSPSQDMDDVGWVRASLSRERLVPGQLVTVQGELKNWGATPQQRRVGCVVNGRPVPEHQTTIRLPPGYTVPVSFEVRLPTHGPHAVSLRCETDALPGNDRVDLVVEVITGMNVLLVDGSPSADSPHSDIYFAQAALERSADEAGWVKLKSVSVAELNSEVLHEQDVVILANISPRDTETTALLDAFVNRGGAVLVACGEQSGIPPDAAFAVWRDFLPVEFTAWHAPPDIGHVPTQVAAESLTRPWLERFRPDRGGELCAATFRGWWTTQLAERKDGDKPVVLARFGNGDPWLVAARHGKGMVMVATSPLDAEANSLPTKPDFVAWLHELLLAISEPPQRRNLAVGEAMFRGEFPSGSKPVEWLDPWGRVLPVDEAGAHAIARWPGIYVVVDPTTKRSREDDPQWLCGTSAVEAFAAQTDGDEADRTPLSEVDRVALSAGRALRFYDSVEEWQRDQSAAAPRSELGGALLWALLAVLVVESLITHRRAHRAGT